MYKIITRIMTFFLIPSLLLSAQFANACTRVLRVDKDNAVMVGRNMDWLEDMKSNLAVYPRGMQKFGDFGDNPLMWTSKYGSIVATAYGVISTDGMNEAGLSAHILWLDGYDFGKHDNQKADLSVLLWIEYYLDNFKSVAEAVSYTEANPPQIVPYFNSTLNRWLKLHLVLDDASGDSAILEYSEGKLHIYHNRNYIAATNDPTYDKQLENLKMYKGFGGEKPLPGSSLPQDRFVRAAYYTENLPTAASTKEELAAVLSIINNAAQPYTKGTSDKPHMSKTIWHSVADMTHRVYYFQSAMTQNLVSVSLDKFNLNEGAPVMRLDLVEHPEYVGDVAAKFEPV